LMHYSEESLLNSFKVNK